MSARLAPPCRVPAGRGREARGSAAALSPVLPSFLRGPRAGAQTQVLVSSSLGDPRAVGSDGRGSCPDGGLPVGAPGLSGETAQPGRGRLERPRGRREPGTVGRVWTRTPRSSRVEEERHLSEGTCGGGAGRPVGSGRWRPSATCWRVAGSRKAAREGVGAGPGAGRLEAWGEAQSLEMRGDVTKDYLSSTCKSFPRFISTTSHPCCKLVPTTNSKTGLPSRILVNASDTTSGCKEVTIALWRKMNCEVQ